MADKPLLVALSRRRVILTAGGTASVAAVGALWTARPDAGTATGPRRTTSFGSIRLVGSERLAVTPGGAPQRAHDHAHDHGQDVADEPAASAVHGAWTAAVVVDVEVHNGSPRAVPLSPGQLRLRVDHGPTVSLYSADRAAAPAPAGSTTQMRVTYLAPPADRRLVLEFDDPGAPGPIRLGPVGRLLRPASAP